MGSGQTKHYQGLRKTRIPFRKLCKAAIQDVKPVSKNGCMPVFGFEAKCQFTLNEICKGKIEDPTIFAPLSDQRPSIHVLRVFGQIITCGFMVIYCGCGRGCI